MSFAATKRQTKSKILSVIVMLALMLVSLLTFSACKLFNTEDPLTNATYDESGRLRLVSPTVTFHPFSTNGSKVGQFIDDNSGSFTWPLTYYHTGGTDIEHDQAYYKTNFYTVNVFASNFEGEKEDYLFKYFLEYATGATETKKLPIYTNDVDTILRYYGFGSVNDVDGLRNGIDSVPHFYGLDRNSPEAGTRGRIIRLYTGFDEVAQSYRTDRNIIEFPDYEVVVDGRYYTFRVVLRDGISFNMPTDTVTNLLSNPLSYTGSNRIFDFYFRSGKASTAGAGLEGFTKCPDEYMTYFVDDDGTYVIRFNPRLEEGTKNRYLKVKAIPVDLDGDRGESIYSGTVSFEAYTMTFDARGTNSVETDFGGLVYNQDKYYFFNKVSAYDSKTDTEYVKSITGAFPEGRQVVISRYTQYTTSYNYAFQSWTTNTYAENGNVIKESMPKGYKYNSGSVNPSKLDEVDYDGYNESFVGTASQYIPDSKYGIRAKDVIPAAREMDPNMYDTINVSGESKDTISYHSQSESTLALENYVYDHMYDVYNERGVKTGVRSDLIVTSHTRLHATKFVANWAKVRGFVVSGTFFAGDNFFTGSDQHLRQVDISIYTGEGTYLLAQRPVSNVSNTYTMHTYAEYYSNSGVNNIHFGVDQAYRTQAVTIKQDGSYFSVSGLEWNDYVFFEKISDPVNQDDGVLVKGTLPFNFHSPLMDTRVVQNVEKKVISLKASDKLFSDRQDIAVIGTQFNEDSHLVVNLYQITENTDNAQIDSKYIKQLQKGLVSYEIVKSVSSYEDEFGYIQTNVIISLLLPSNAVLVGYNLETINDASTLFYTDDAGNMYVTQQVYNAETTELDRKAFFKVSTERISNVTSNQNSSAIEYNGEIFLYSHKSGSSDALGNVKTTYFYNSTTDFNGSVNNQSNIGSRKYKVIAFVNNEYTLLTYDEIPEENVSITVDPPTGSDDQSLRSRIYITYNGVKREITQYSQNNELFSNEASEVSTIANVHMTDMRQQSNGVEQTVYVYYDIKAVGSAYYYTSALAKRQLVGGTGNFKETIVQYFPQITNFDELVQRGTIMLGSAIMSSSDPLVAAYREAMGARLVSSCYYYVKRLGVASRVYVKQYIQNQDNGVQSQYTNNYYFYEQMDDSGAVVIRRFSGGVTPTSQNIITGEVNSFDFAGQRLDTSVYSNVINNKLYDSTGQITYKLSDSNQDNALLPINYFNSHYQAADSYEEGSQSYDKYYDLYYSGLNNIAPPVSDEGNLVKNLRRDFYLRIEYTFYTIIDGKPLTQALIGVKTGSEMRYYIADRTIIEQVKNESGDVIGTRTAYIVNPDTYYTITFVNNRSVDFAQRIAIANYTKHTTSGGATSTEFFDTTVKYNSYQLGNNDITSTQSTGYKAFLIPSYYAIDSEDGERVELSSGDNSNYYSKKINATETKLFVGVVDSSNNRKAVYTSQVSFNSVFTYTIRTENETKNDIRYYVNSGVPLSSAALESTAFPYWRSERQTTEGKYFGHLLDPNGEGWVYDRNKQPIYVDTQGYLVDASGNYILSGGDKVVGAAELFSVTTMSQVQEIVTSLVRAAFLELSNESVTILGKFIETNDVDNPVIYPGFSRLDSYTEEDAYILAANKGKFDHYYSLDYTSKNLVVEGFPGVSLLAGPPYPNQVLYFSIRHKADEDAVVNLSFDIRNAYFVEVLGQSIERPNDINIYDFNTYAFKDTLTNLSLNDYMDKTFWVLDRTTFKAVVPYIYVNGEYVKILEQLSLQEVGINDNDTGDYLYYNQYVGSNGKYLYRIYMQYYAADGSIAYKPIDYNKDVFIWSSTSTSLEAVRTYDIHSYTQGLDGTLYLNSGMDTDANMTCYGFEGFNYDAQFSTNSMFNYDEVLFSGVTYAYRTKASQVTASTNDYMGYWLDRGINIMDAYDSTNAYFLTGREAAVLLASPVVSLQDDGGHNYIYRFKEWKIYTRRNSEVIFYNRALTEAQADRYNAILRFSSEDAGYYVIMPVYQRVYTIDIGTAVIDGALNQGGGIDIMYDDGSDELDVEGRTDRELYLYNYLKTIYGDREGYFYGDIDGSLFMYFTGEFTTPEGERDTPVYPVFEVRDDIFAVRYHQMFGDFSTGEITLYFQVRYNSTKTQITGVRPLNVLSRLEEGVPGIVTLSHSNDVFEYLSNTITAVYSDGTYTYQYGDSRLETHLFYDEGNFFVKTAIGVRQVAFRELFSYAFNSYFYFDTVNGATNQGYKGVPLFYDSKSGYMRAFDTDYFNNKTASVVGDSFTFIQYLLFWNMRNNSSLFDDNAAAFQDIFKDNVRHRDDDIWKPLASSNSNLDYWPMTFTGNDALSFNSMLNDYVAKVESRIYTGIDAYINNKIGDMYLSRYGSLSDGELVLDENGNLYSTQQFKKTYIDRDAYVRLEAVPAQGYRVEGWYKCIYDADTDSWYTTDEKVENTSYTYSDEVIGAYYNPILREYFYITAYHQKLSGTDTDIYYYSYDEERGYYNEAIVPDRMLDAVRGYYIDENQNSNLSPNYVQVYKNYENNYYYDVGMHSNPVDIDTYTPVEMTHIEAINRSSAANDIYTLSKRPVFRRIETSYDENGDPFDTEHFYRVRETGNIVVEGNTLIINALHSNVRYVAKFIEIYNEYIFAEDEDSSGIGVLAVYYNNSDPRKAEDDYPVIRTNNMGVNKTAPETDALGSITYDGDLTTAKDRRLNTEYLRLYEDTSKGDLVSSTFDVPYTKTVRGESVRFSAYDSKSVSNYRILTQNDGFASRAILGKPVFTPTYRVNIETDKCDKELNGELTLKSMYFDVDTNVFILVRVKADYDLTIHSLGLNSNYTIEPIFQPTEDFIAYNKTASTDKSVAEGGKVDYLFYIFKISYNRDPENEFANYIVHPNRGESMAFDVLAGNYLPFYNNYFDHYIIDNVHGGTEYQFVEGRDYEFVVENSQTMVRLLSRNNNAFLRRLWLNGRLSDELYEKYCTEKFKNFSELLTSLNRDLRNPEYFVVGYVKLKAGTFNPDSAGELATKKLTTSEDIYSAIRCLYKTNASGSVVYENGNPVRQFKSPYLIWSGQQNFVNLSSIVVYTYTIQAITLDDTSPTLDRDDKGKVVMKGSTLVEHYLLNQVYTAAGTNGRTYLGAGTAGSADYNYYAPDGGAADYYGSTVMHFSSHYTDLEWGGDNADDKTLLPDLPFAKDTIILFDGVAGNAAGETEEGYAFAGWYEQTYDRDSDTWSPLALMSTSPKVPYLAMAEADTVVVALYKKVIDVTIKYPQDNGEVFLLNGSVDSLGNPITYSNGSYSGKFYFDADLSMMIVPNGGYRFDTTITYDEKDEPLESGAYSQMLYTNNPELSFYTNITADRPEGYKTSYDQIRLNGVFSMTIPIKQALYKNRSTSEDGIVQTPSSLYIALAFKKIMLVYIDVDNFVYGTGEGNNYTFGGFDFALYRISGSSVSASPFFTTNGASRYSQFRAGAKDSTQSQMVGKVVGTHLYVYGYFDYDLSGQLLLTSTKTTSKDITMDGWYINGATTSPTNSLEPLKTNYHPSATNEFVLTFLYTDEDKLVYNTKSNFALSESNSVYHLSAQIPSEDENQQVVVTHSFIESIDDALVSGISAGNPHYNTNVYSLVNFSGTYSDGGYTSENGSFIVKNKQVLHFSKDALVSIAVQDEYVIVKDGANSYLYVFIGWFELDFDYVEGETQTTFIQKEPVLQYTKAQGAYEAKYVRAFKIQNNIDEENGTISYSAEQHIAGLGDLSVVHTIYGYYSNGATSYNYVLAGATLTVSAVPNDGYFIIDGDIKATGLDGSEIDFEVERQDTASILSFVADRDSEIYIDFTKGYSIILSQTLYPSLDMRMDGTSLTATRYINISAGEVHYNSFEFAVQEKTTLTFSAIDNMEYYFVGFYINGKIVSTTESGGKTIYQTEYTREIDDDLMIEARFVPYVRAYIASSIRGTNNSGISNFAASLSYTDLRTGNTATYEYSNSSSAYVQLPAGMQITISENRPENAESNPYSFVEWSVVDSSNAVFKYISSAKEAILGVSEDLQQCTNSGNRYARIVAFYTETTRLNISKEIIISDADRDTYEVGGQLGDLFKSFFDINVRYTDIYGVERQVSLGANMNIDGIVIQRNSHIIFEVIISNTVKNRYYVSALETTSRKVTNDIVSDDLSHDMVFTNSSSVDIRAVFAPVSFITISKELNGQVTNYDSLEVSYAVTNTQTDTVMQSGTVGAPVTIRLFYNADISIECSCPDGYVFLGLFRNGKIVTGDIDINPGDNCSFVARFVSSASISGEIIIDGSSETGVDGISMDVLGTFIKESEDGQMIGKFDQISLNKDRMTFDRIAAEISKEIVLVANNIDGYRFKGFTILVDGVERRFTEVANSYGTVARIVIQNGTEVHISATYEKVYPISYSITTLNGENAPSSQGGSISQFDYFFAKGQTSVSFDVYISRGYRLYGIYLNGERVARSDSFANGDTVTLDIPEGAESLNVEIKYVKNVTIGVRVAVQGTNDANEMQNKLGIDPTQFAVNINDQQFTFNTENSVYTNISNQFVVGSYAALGITYGGKQSFTAADGITYVFDGYYVYDGTNVASSAYAIAYQQNINFMLNGDVSIVAKFVAEDDENIRSVATQRSFEFFNGTEVKELASFDGVVENQIATFEGSNYLFIGYYTRLSTGTLGYLKLAESYDADLDAYDGIYPNIIARFVKIVKITTNFTKPGVVGFNNHVDLKYSVDLSAGSLGTLAGVTTTLVGSVVESNVSVLSGYNLSSTGATFNETQKTFTYGDTTPLTDDIVEDVVVNKTGIVTNVTSTNDKITAVVVTNVNGESSLVVEHVNETVDAEFSISNVDSATLHVSIYDESGEITEFDVTAEDNNKTVKIKTGSVITLSNTINGNTEFGGYRIVYGTSQFEDTVTYSYYLANKIEGATLNISASFFKIFTATIKDIDNSRGKAQITRNNNDYVLETNANEGFYIANIYVSEIVDNVVSSEKIDLLSADEAAFGELLSKSVIDRNFKGAVSVDGLGKSILTSARVTISLRKNVAISIVLLPVVKLNLHVVSNTLRDVRMFYYFETTLNIDMLTAFIDAAIAEDPALDSLFNYQPKELCSFTFENSLITEQPINLENLVEISVYLNKQSQGSFKVKIETITASDGSKSIYNTPTDGLKVSLGLGGTEVGNISNELGAFQYQTSTSTPIYAFDNNNYFRFVGFYAAPNRTNLVTESQSYSFTYADFGEGSKFESEGGDIVVYAVFEEIINEITIRANYESSSFVLKANGTELAAPTETIQIYEGFNTTESQVGNLAYRTSEGNLVISYPLSLCKAEAKFSILANDFELSTDADPFLESLGLDGFYEKTIAGETMAQNTYLRFKQYTNFNGELVGSAYNPELQIDLGKEAVGNIITASATKVYLIEFAYDCPSPEYKIVLYLTRVDFSSGTPEIKYIAISESCNQTEFDKALIRYKAEEGTALKASVEPIGAVEITFSLVGSTTVMLSELFGGMSFGTAEGNLPTGDGAKSWWEEKLVGSFSPIVQTFNYNAKVGNLSSFSFTASQNISILAEKYNTISFNRKYPVVVLYNPETLDGMDNYETAASIEVLASGTNNNKRGEGFALDFAGNGQSVTVNETKFEGRWYRNSRNEDANFYTYTDDLDFNISDLITESMFTQTIFHRYSKTFTTSNDGEELSFTFKNLPYFSISIDGRRRLRKEFSESNIFESITDRGFIYSNLSVNLNSSSYGTHTSLYNNRYAKNGTTINVTATVPEGYFFKGFLVVSSGYSTGVNVLTFGGETMNSNLMTYTLIPGNFGTKGVVSASFVVRGNIQIYALYEARIYVVTLKSYEFVDDEEHPDLSSKMTDSEITASKFKGSLLIQRGVDAMLTSINFPYVQLAGWSTTRDYYTAHNGNGTAFKAAASAAKDTPSNFRSDATTLTYDDLIPKNNAYNNETKMFDSFPITAMTSYLYIFDVQNDLDLNVYYVSMSYTLTINLAEVLGVYVNQDTNYGISESQTDSYLTYADYIRNQNGWRNPSAGTYVYETLSQTNSRNAATTRTTIVIKPNDPYVYVLNDYKGNIITPEKLGKSPLGYAYPTRVPMSLVSMGNGSYSAQNGKLSYVFSSRAGGRDTLLQIITESNYTSPESADNTIDYPYHPGFESNRKAIAAYYDLEDSETNIIDASKLDKIMNRDSTYAIGFSGDNYESTDSGVPKLDNIYNYINISNNSVKLKDDLFTITIQGDDGTKTYSSQNLPEAYQPKIDLVNGTITIKIKIIASSSGFPSVVINQQKTQVAKNSIIDASILAEKYRPTNQTDVLNNRSSFNGCHVGLYDNVDLTDPNIDFGNLDVNLIIKWKKLAVPVEASVKLGGTEYVISGRNMTGNKNALADRGSERGIGCNDNKSSQSLVAAHSDEIESFYITVIQNGQFLLDMLQFLTDDPDTNYKTAAQGVITFLDSLAAGGMGEDGEVYNIGNAGVVGRPSTLSYDSRSSGFGTVGSVNTSVTLLDWEENELTSAISLTRADGNQCSTSLDVIVELVRRYIQRQYNTDWISVVGGYDNARATVKDFFRVKTVVDVYGFFKNGIATTMAGSYFNTNDFVISQCVLEEHTIPQHNQTTFWLFGTHIWSADKGFDYIRHARMGIKDTFTSVGLSNNEYDNGEQSSSPKKSVKWTKAAKNYIVGIFNGRDKYAGTYMRLLHTSLSATTDEIGTSIKSVTAYVNISTGEDDRIPTALHDWDSIPFKNALLAAVAIIGSVVLIVASGGSAAFAIGALLLIDGIVRIATGNNKSLFTMLVNLNF